MKIDLFFSQNAPIFHTQLILVVVFFMYTEIWRQAGFYYYKNIDRLFMLSITALSFVLVLVDIRN